MGEYLLYNEIIAGQRNVQEWLEKGNLEPDPALVQDLVTLFTIENNENKIHTLFSLQENLYEKLNYSYNEFGERDYKETRDIRYKQTLNNIQRKKEITLIQESEKIKFLEKILKKGELIDKIRFIDYNDNEKICLSTIIWFIETGEDPILHVISEFVANTSWDIIEGNYEDSLFYIDVANIKEVVADGIKYNFLT